MREFIQRIDFWLMVGALLMAVLLEIDKIRAWWKKIRPTVKRSEGGAYKVMSRPLESRPVPTGSGTGSAVVVPPQQHQPEPAAPASIEDVVSFLSRHKLESPEQVIDILSVLQFGDDHVLSANKIRDVVGGNEKAVKARVASHRTKEEAPKKTSSRLDRPIDGWG